MKRVFALLLAVSSLVGCKKEQATAAKAHDMLAEFTKPGANHQTLYAALRPKPEDYEAVFVGDTAAKAKAAMEPLWDSGKYLDPTAEQTEISVNGATPDQLAKHEGNAASCPGGYKAIADKLNPKIVVYCARFSKPGEKGGLTVDAIVFVNGHWAYFPKPFRILNAAASVGTAVAAPPPASAAPAASGTP
jgi:hypothetical protein